MFWFQFINIILFLELSSTLAQVHPSLPCPTQYTPNRRQEFNAEVMNCLEYCCPQNLRVTEYHTLNCPGASHRFVVTYEFRIPPAHPRSKETLKELWRSLRLSHPTNAQVSKPCWDSWEDNKFIVEYTGICTCYHPDVRLPRSLFGRVYNLFMRLDKNCKCHNRKQPKCGQDVPILSNLYSYERNVKRQECKELSNKYDGNIMNTSLVCLT